MVLSLNSSEFETYKRNLNGKTKMHFDGLETISSFFVCVVMKYIASVFVRAGTHTCTKISSSIFWHLNLVEISTISTLNDMWYLAIQMTNIFFCFIKIFKEK